MKHMPATLAGVLLSFVMVSDVFAQQDNPRPAETYQTESNIAYYQPSSIESDDYMKQCCMLDLYFPSDRPGFATVVWFHGGGLRAGNRSVPQQLKRQNIAVAAVDYRLYPKVSCPAYIQDAAASIAWVIKNIQDYGGDPNLVFVSGHSAGGYLTAISGLDKQWLAEYDIDADQIAGLIPFSGHTITHFTVREERGIPGTRPIIDEFAPLYHVRPDAPPLVLITGDRDLEMLGRYEENAYMMRMMKVVGHPDTSLYELQGFDHGGMADPAFSILLKHVSEIVQIRRGHQAKRED